MKMILDDLYSVNSNLILSYYYLRLNNLDRINSFVHR